jgi:DNA-binding transcriptional LysR family regulator
MLNEIDLSRVDLNLLTLFEVVLEQRHVGRAAKQLNLSASAVSHGLARLRRMLDDPLFLRTPKGVVPTDRAAALAAPIADILARVRALMASGQDFDPASSTRRFVIGAPDGVSAVFLQPVLERLRTVAPGIDLGIRELLPPVAARSSGHVWEAAFADLDARAIDLAVLPLAEAPARFAVLPLYEDEFVIAARANHPFVAEPGLDRFCAAPQLVVSLTSDAHGFVDDALAREGRARRIALTVPNFMMALAMVAESDLIAALPQRLVRRHARRFGVVSVAAPIALPRFQISVIVPKAALADDAVRWVTGLLEGAPASEPV